MVDKLKYLNKSQKQPNFMKVLFLKIFTFCFMYPYNCTK